MCPEPLVFRQVQCCGALESFTLRGARSLQSWKTIARMRWQCVALVATEVCLVLQALSDMENLLSWCVLPAEAAYMLLTHCILCCFTLLWLGWIYQGMEPCVPFSNVSFILFYLPSSSSSCCHQSLIINQIIQLPFSNPVSINIFLQIFLLSLLFDVCWHLLFIAHNLSAAELLTVMDLCDTFHYSIWILFNHQKCVSMILQRFSSHFTEAK